MNLAGSRTHLEFDLDLVRRVRLSVEVRLDFPFPRQRMTYVVTARDGNVVGHGESRRAHAVRSTNLDRIRFARWHESWVFGTVACVCRGVRGEECAIGCAHLDVQKPHVAERARRGLRSDPQIPQG